MIHNSFRHHSYLSMHLFVSHQHITIPETFVTHLTLEIVDARVGRQVFSQVIPHRESLAAKFALVWVDSLVLVHVVLISLLAAEGPIAQLTAESLGLLLLLLVPCRGTHRNLKVQKIF